LGEEKSRKDGLSSEVGDTCRGWAEGEWGAGKGGAKPSPRKISRRVGCRIVGQKKVTGYTARQNQQRNSGELGSTGSSNGNLGKKRKKKKTNKSENKNKRAVRNRQPGIGKLFTQKSRIRGAEHPARHEELAPHRKHGWTTSSPLNGSGGRLLGKKEKINAIST